MFIPASDIKAIHAKSYLWVSGRVILYVTLRADVFRASGMSCPMQGPPLKISQVDASHGDSMWSSAPGVVESPSRIPVGTKLENHLQRGDLGLRPQLLRRKKGSNMDTDPFCILFSAVSRSLWRPAINKLIQERHG
jgi:hypothetical protein